MPRWWDGRRNRLLARPTEQRGEKSSAQQEQGCGLWDRGELTTYVHPLVGCPVEDVQRRGERHRVDRGWNRPKLVRVWQADPIVERVAKHWTPQGWIHGGQRRVDDRAEAVPEDTHFDLTTRANATPRTVIRLDEQVRVVLTTS